MSVNFCLFRICTSLVFGILTLVSGQNSYAQADAASPRPSDGVPYLMAIGDSLLSIDENKKAQGYYAQALKESEKQRNESAALSAKIKLAQTLVKLSEYNAALEHLKTAESNPLLPNNKPEEQAKVFSLLGAIYEALGNYDNALDYQLQALENREKAGNAEGTAESLYKIGSMYFSQEKYDKSLEYYKKALHLCEKDISIPRKNLLNCLSAVGSAYEELGDQQESLRYNSRALESAIQIGNDKNKAYALLNIGENYTNLKNYSKAKEYLLKAMKTSTALDNHRLSILCHLRMGELQMQTNTYADAEKSLRQAYLLCIESASNSILMEVLERLAQLQQLKGNYEASNAYLREYIMMKDSLINESSNNQIIKLNTLYEVGKKENAIKVLQQEKELAEIRRKGNQRTMIGLSVFLAALAGLLIWVLILVRRQRESNKVLQELNGQIESQNLTLQSYNEELRQYAYVASHDLQEPLRTIGSFVGIIKRKYTDQLDEQAQQYMDFVTNGVARLQLLLKDLLAYTRIERENTDFAKVETTEVVNEVIGSLHQVIQDSGARIDLDVASMPAVMGNRSRLGQVFQNLISNGIKFRGEQAPVVEVGCMPDPDKKEYLFYVKDNGIGIPEEFRVKMFEMFTRLHSRDAYEGSGIGLATCRKIVEKHGGKIWAESEAGMGSAIFFTLPFIQ